MCAGLTIPLRELNDDILEQYDLRDRITEAENGEQEVRFLFRAPKPVLPARVRDRLGVYEWGNRDHRESKLPHTGWCRIESLEQGKWNWLHPEPVEIPCDRGVEKGVWFRVPGEAIKGVLVKDESGQEHVYMLTQPATHAYQELTHHEREPVFVRGTI